MISKDTYLRIQELSKLGVSNRKIAPQVGVSHSQVGKYAKMSEEEFDRSHAKMTAKRRDYEVYRMDIISILQKYPEAKPSAILNRLKMEYPDFQCSEQAFVRYIKRLREEQGILLPERKESEKNYMHYSLRETPPPGYEAQVDFGEKVLKDMYGKSRKIHIFVMVLNYSNLMFACCNYEPFTAVTAVDAHRKAFEFFGGRTKTILYDNDTVFNNGHNFGEPVLTKAFEAFVEDVGFGVRFCKSNQWASKGTVEAAVSSVKSFLDARVYAGIDSLNSELLEWLDRVQNARPNLAKGVTAHELFAQEASALVKVPKYRKEQTVFAACSDNVIRYKHNLYEMPMYKVLKGARVKVIDEGHTLAFVMAESDEFLCRHPLCTEQGKRIALPDKDFTQGRTSIESLQLHFRGNSLVEEFTKAGKETNPRYIVTLCIRIRALSRLVPEQVIFDGMKWCMEKRKYTVREFNSYLYYRGFSDALSKNGDKDHTKLRKRAAEIREEIDNG